MCLVEMCWARGYWVDQVVEGQGQRLYLDRRNKADPGFHVGGIDLTLVDDIG